MKYIYLLVTFFILFLGTNAVAQTTDYLQIISYGQSLSMGWQAPRAITNLALDNNYMMGSDVNTLYSSGATTLNPLVAKKWKSGGEQPIVSCVNTFSKAYRENINANQKFIAVSAGEGGKTIERLSKECTNDGYYESTFIKALDNTLAAINGETVSCPAIIYMQGEHNSVAWRAANQGLTPGTNGTLDKTVYKDLLLKLKNNMQADIVAKYGQSEKPLFFIYQTSGGYLQIKDIPVVMAQIEFAEENSDVVLLNPHYAMPDYSRGHLSTNGYRWYGELMSKTLIQKLVTNADVATLKATNFEIERDKIIIDYYVPTPPLVFDTWTTPMQSNYGFEIYQNGSIVDINSIDIIGENKVEITCGTNLTGKVEIVYAGTTVNGSGNLRDSDMATSMYTYYNDSADSLQESYTPTTQNGGSIYGQSYGLQNWSNAFYYSIGENNTIGDTFTSENYHYKVTNVSPNEVEVTGADIVPVEISIPTSVINEGIKYDVKSVGYYAFYKQGGYAAPTSIVVAEGITSIKETAFNNLLNVTSVELPSTLTEIVYRAFRQCEALTSIIIPEGIIELEAQVFLNCYALSSVTIPSSVKSIGDSTFKNTGLTSLTILATTPPTLHTNAFRDVTLSKVKLYVPAGSKELYEIATIWKNFDIEESEALSVDKIDEKSSIIIIPNPTGDIVSVFSEDKIININVLSANGHLVLESNSAGLDFSNFVSGVYFVKVKTIKGSFVKRVIKK